MYIPGPGPAIVLPHIIKLARKMFIERVHRADRGAIAHPIVKAPVIEHFIRDKPREIRFVDLEGVL